VFFSRVFHWVPPLSYVSFFEDPVQNLQEFFMPAISISVFTLAIVMRMVRATMLDVLNLDYVRTARAKGVPRRKVLRSHALRNALIPVVTVVGFEVGVLIGGAAIVEIIFGLPGVGYTLLNAISNRDYPVIQTATLIIASVFVVANMAVDLVYGFLDPRISVS
jgi:peptide/nickel transport system permease protein